MLLQKKGLDEILLQDITEGATVNRATFYDHYTDKFGLFDAMIASDFHKLLEERNIRIDGSCSSGFAAIILAVVITIRNGSTVQAGSLPKSSCPLSCRWFFRLWRAAPPHVTPPLPWLGM